MACSFRLILSSPKTEESKGHEIPPPILSPLALARADPDLALALPAQGEACSGVHAALLPHLGAGASGVGLVTKSEEVAVSLFGFIGHFLGSVRLVPTLSRGWGRDA